MNDIDFDRLDEQEILVAASAVEDHLLDCGLTTDFAHGQYTYTLRSSTAQTVKTQYGTVMLDMIEQALKPYYENSWGWNRAEKEKELFHRDSRLLTVNDSEGTIVAFAAFRFTWDDEEEPEWPVLYCYELHVSAKCRGLGLGAHLVDLQVA
jgi:ribosomal protein S18 acetylase RimI-like enzyme